MIKSTERQALETSIRNFLFKVTWTVHKDFSYSILVVVSQTVSFTKV